MRRGVALGISTLEDPGAPLGLKISGLQAQDSGLDPLTHPLSQTGPHLRPGLHCSIIFQACLVLVTLGFEHGPCTLTQRPHAQLS